MGLGVTGSKGSGLLKVFIFGLAGAVLGLVIGTAILVRPSSNDYQVGPVLKATMAYLIITQQVFHA